MMMDRQSLICVEEEEGEAAGCCLWPAEKYQVTGQKLFGELELEAERGYHYDEES